MRKLLLLSAALIFSLQAHADDKVKLQMDWIASGEHAAYYGG